MTPEEAKQVIDQERKKRLSDCWRVINETLQKYACQLEPVVIIRGGEIRATVDLIAKE
jgi:hypothetical protein